MVVNDQEKTNKLLNVIKHHRPDIDKIYLYVKDPFKPKYQLLINGREKVGLENLKNPNTFIDYSKTINDIYENLEEQQRKSNKEKESVNTVWWYDSRYGIQ